MPKNIKQIQIVLSFGGEKNKFSSFFFLPELMVTSDI